MTREIEVDLSDVQVFQIGGRYYGGINLRVVIHAADTENWFVGDIGVEGFQSKSDRFGRPAGLEWDYGYVDAENPDWVKLHAAIMQTQLRQLKVAIADKLQDIRAGITDAPFAPMSGIDSGDVRKHYEEV